MSIPKPTPYTYPQAQSPPPVGGSVPASPSISNDQVLAMTQNPNANNSVNSAGNNTNTSGYGFTYPTSSDGMYFTATQAMIYMGNLYIDELVSLQFTYQGNRIPIYGYSSVDADAFGTGKRLVQGQFAINLVCEGYLYVALDQYGQMTYNTQGPASSTTQSTQALANQINSVNSTIQQFGNPTASNASQQQALLDTIDSYAAGLGPGGIAQAKAILSQGQSNLFDNAITVDTPFDIVINMVGGGRTITRKIENCILTSNDQVYDQSGEVLLDSYGFIGRSAK